MKNTVKAINPPISWVKSRIEEAGSKIGNVWFIKRKDNSLRKMCYKIGVSNPKNVKAPKGFKESLPSHGTCVGNGMQLTWNKSKYIDEANLQMRVYDVNHVNEDGKRGAYRTVPLDRVTRIASNGQVFAIERK